MARKRKDGTIIPEKGIKINHFTLIEPALGKRGRKAWLCECDCENKTRKVVEEYRLVSESTKSCGCAKRMALQSQHRFNGLSFKEWCELNGRQDLLERWDAELNEFFPSEIGIGSKRKYWFRCLTNTDHKSELHNIQGLSNGSNQIACRQCNSFGQWCVDNHHEDVLLRWDNEKNAISPFEVSYSSSVKRWFKCPCGKHPSELKTIYSYVDGHTKSLDCKLCNSFAEVNIKRYGPQFLDLYWSEKNTINPWQISFANNDQKIYIRCQEDATHEDYILTPGKFNGGRRCPICGLDISKSKLQKDVEKYLVEKGYDINMEFNCSIITYSPINNRPMPYDFEVPELKLVIEVQGEQHYKLLRTTSPWLRGMTPEEFLQTRRSYDQHKKDFAIQQGYNYLEIFHSEHQNDSYKEKIDRKIQDILDNK